MESSPGEDAVQTAEMTTEDLEDYINLVDPAVAESERTGSDFERSFLWVKCTTCHREIIHDSQSMRQTSLSYFKKLPLPPQPSVTTTLISQQPQPWR